MIGRLFLVLFLGVLLVAAVAGCDSGQAFTASEKRVAQAPVVQWVLRDGDVGEECARRGAPIDNAHGCAIRSTTMGQQCTIVTNRDTTYHILGHELRHCFEPLWAGHK